MSLVKKIVSSFVSFTMVASTVGTGLLALPGAASAATLASGDLIKASGPAVYYYGSDAKRYVFPNENTFFSWFMDFSSVKTITDSELAAIQIGGNMTIRPGTKLVKITTDPKVYAVSPCGVLHWVESESVATSLFGSSWARRVVDVPDAFFVNYSVGSSVATAVHPDGSLISKDGYTYVVWNGQARKLVGAGMSANMYNAANALPTTISYPMGADVTGRESALSDGACIAQGPVATGSLTVALASDTPAGATLPKNSSGSMLAKFNLTGGAAAATVTGFSIHRVGVGAVSDFSNLYLYDANGTRLTTGRSLNSSSNKVEFNGLNMVVGAGQTVSVVLVGDVAAPSTTGGQHAFEIMDAASVVTSATGTTIGGSFPVRGNTFVVGTASAARLDITKGSTPADANVGSTQVEISNFRLAANTNDIEVRRVTLFQGGDISNSDLRNFNLYQGATLVATASAVTGSGQIVLNFNPPYLIPSGNTRVFSLRADISGRSGRSIRTYVEFSTDVYAVDRTYGSGAQVCTTSSGTCTSGSFDGSSFSSCSSAGNNICLSTKGGQLTVAFNGPATQNVAKGQNGVVLYNFALTSQSSQLEIRNMSIVLGSIDGGRVCPGSGNTCTDDFFKNVRIVDTATGQALQGPTSASAGTITGTGATSTLSYSNSVYLQVGQTRNLSVLADLANSDDSSFKDHSYNVTFSAFGSNDIRVVDTGEYLVPSTSVVPSSAITGNTLTVKSASLSATLASNPSSMTVVKKQQNVPALGINFQSGAQSDVTVTAVKVTGKSGYEGASAAASQLRTTVSSCGLFDGTTQVGLSMTPDSTGVMNFTNLNWRMVRGANKILMVQCTMGSVLGGATYDTFQLGLVNGSDDITAQDQDSNSVTATTSAQLAANGTSSSPSVAITVRNKGTVSIVSDSMQQSTILVPPAVGQPETWYPVAQFSANAQYEDMRIERLLVTSTGDAASITGIAIAKDGTMLGNPSSLSGTISGSQDLDLSASPIIVPKDNSVRFQLWARLASVRASSTSVAGTPAARSGNLFSLGIAAGNTSGEYDSNYSSSFNAKVVGLGSGERVYASGSTTRGNSFEIRKTKPVVSVATASSVLNNNSVFPLMTFTVGADSAGSISLKKLSFSFSKSTTTASAMSLSTFKMFKAGDEMDSSLYTIVDTNGTALTSAGVWPVASTTGRIVVVFTNPEVISGQGYEYSLRANVAAALPGDSVSVGFLTGASATPVTGYLTSSSAATNFNSVNLPGPNLNTTTSGTLVVTNPGTFVWSDRSETSAPGSATSGDWTDDLYVRRFDTVSYTR